MKIQTWTLAGLTLASLLAACGPATNTDDRGAVQIAVTARGAGARTAGMTYLVTASVSGPATATLTLAESTTPANSWTGSLTSLPVGLYVVTAEATESPSGKVFRASAACPVSKNAVSLCALSLQQVGGTTTFIDVAPLIGAISLSDVPSYGAPLTVSMTASFLGDSLRYSITALCDGVAEPVGAVVYGPTVDLPTLAGWDHTVLRSAVLTSSCRGAGETVVFSVTDAKALTSTVSISFAWNAQGLAIVARINHWPDLGQFVTSDAQIPAGGTFSVLGVNATDADGDALTFKWTSGCGGRFDGASIEKTTFIAPAAPFAGPCKLSVAVTDGQGGSNSGDVTIQVGEPGATVHSRTVVTAAGVEVVSVPDAPPGLGGSSIGKVTQPTCANSPDCKGQYYFTPAGLFGHPVTLGQVKGISFWTKKAATQPDDWYLYVYTAPYPADTVGPHGSWYGARVLSMPSLAENPTANAGQWINWTSETGSDWLRFSESTGNNFAPATLHLPEFVASSSFAGVPFAGQPVLYFSVQTASDTELTFTGQMG